MTATVDWGAYRAVLFDLDGVITPTAEIHQRAWKALFDQVLADHHVEEPYTTQDYFDHVDGKPRYDGVRDLLASRDIELPEGDQSDPPDQPAGEETVCGLGNRKDKAFGEELHRDGIAAYPGSQVLLDELRDRGMPMAIVSSSKNAPDVLDVAGLTDYFAFVMHGGIASDRQLKGKPAPDTFLAAAAELGVGAEAAVVFEDATSGVAAGRAGDFALVVGVDRGAGAEALTRHGADLVVDDLLELTDHEQQADHEQADHEQQADGTEHA